jgi:hypothetical protein
MNEFIMSSPVNVLGTKNKDFVTLICQFFIHEDKKRNEQIKKCLKYNVENEHIDKIILLNEKKYTDDELGIKHKKIRQVNINKRLTYKDVFNCVQGDRLNGYIICCNADIFFDDTLKNIFNSELHAKKQVLMPLRFDYNDKGKIKYKLFGPRADSCDTWIFHSKFNPSKAERKLTNFNFGTNSCDLKIAYIFNTLGYELINDPFFIKNYHYDNPERERESTETIDGPYLYLAPHLNRDYGTEYHPASMFLSKIKTTVLEYTDNKKIFYDDKNRFSELIQERLNNNIPLIVYRVNNELIKILYHIDIISKIKEDDDEYLTKMKHGMMMNNISELIKNHKNIQNEEFINNLCNINMTILINCDISLHTVPVTKHFQENIEEYKTILNHSKKGRTTILNNSVVSLTNRIDDKLWLENIDNKNILVISENSEEIEKQVPKLNDIWGERKVFDNCNITVLSAPINKDKYELDAFKYINKYKDELLKTLGEKLQNIDLVLIGDTVYSCFLTYIFVQMKKSVFDVGQNLELYFGIYNNQTLEDYKPAIELYRNKHWLKI